MRILHTADWHLGQVLHGYDRSVEHARFLDWLVDAIIVEKIDALIVAGDVFDVANPTVRATKLLWRCIARLRDQAPALNIVLTGGNHDSPRRLELPLSILAADDDAATGPRLVIVGALARRDGAIDLDAAITPLRDASGAVRAVCAAIPFLRAGDVPLGLGQGDDGVAALYRRALDAARRRCPDVPVVLLGHLATTGAAVAGSSERRVSIGGEETVSSAVFPSEAAYVALGHLHRPQTVPGPTLIRYAGAPFPLSATERPYAHSVTIVDLDGDAATIDERPVPRPAAFLRAPERGAAPLEAVERDLTTLDVPAAEPGLEPYLEVAVALDGPTPDLRARIDAALGAAPVRLTRIVCKRADAAPEAASIVAPIGSVDASAIFGKLHAERYGDAPADDLAAAFETLRAEVEIGRDPTEDEAGDDPEAGAPEGGGPSRNHAAA